MVEAGRGANPCPLVVKRGRCLAFPPGIIRVFSEIAQNPEERGWLADEESHVRQEIDNGIGNSEGFCGADDGAWRKLATKERARFRHDQIGLEGFASKWL